MPTMTIYTLAKELNMTPSMVSRAFNPEAKISEEKRQIVLAAAKKYDFSPNRLASRLSRKTVHIGILISSRFAVNTAHMLAGIKAAYAQLKDYKITYDVTVINPLEKSSADYRAALDSYKRCNGIIVSGMSSAKYTPMLRELHQYNPAIVQVQAINDETDYLFASKHSEECASALAAEFLSHCLQFSRKKNVLLFTGDSESALHAKAAATFERACATCGLNLLESVDMKDDEAYFERILPGVFEKHGSEIAGLYMTSGISTPLCRYLEKNGISLPFVAFDTYNEIKHYLKKGIISATISQNVAYQMEVAFDRLVRYLITGEACQKTIYTDVQLVLKSNMHQFG